MHKVGPIVLQSGVSMCRVRIGKKKETTGFLVSLHCHACLAELETLLGPAHEVGCCKRGMARARVTAGFVWLRHGVCNRQPGLPDICASRGGDARAVLLCIPCLWAITIK